MGHATGHQHEDDAEVGDQIADMFPPLADADHAAEREVQQKHGSRPITAGQRQRDDLAFDLGQQEKRLPVEILVQRRIEALVNLFERGEPGQQP